MTDADTPAAAECIEVQRAIAATPADIFAVLAGPQGHVQIDASGMLMSATGDPVTAVGDTFTVHMDREALNDFPLGLYDVEIEIFPIISETNQRATLGILARTVAPGKGRPILD